MFDKNIKNRIYISDLLFAAEHYRSIIAVKREPQKAL